MLSFPLLERFPCRISTALGSGWLNPGMNLYVLRKRVEKHKWCQEALAGPRPSGNSGQAIAKKYISRRVPTLLPPRQCADREDDESSLQISSLTPTTHKLTPRGSLLQEGVAGSLQIPSIIMYIPVPIREITGKICG